jgi:hypothetical protein
MKKKYCMIIDYEVEIDEKIGVPGEEIRPENRDKLQQIIDAFLANPDQLSEFIKYRLYPDYSYSDTPGCNFVDVLQVMRADEICNSLSHHLQPETAAYFFSLLSPSGVYTGADEDYEKELTLLLSHFEKIIPLRASFKEIKGIIEMNDKNPGKEEHEGIMAAVLVIGQMLSTGEILPLPGTKIQRSI